MNTTPSTTQSHSLRRVLALATLAVAGTAATVAWAAGPGPGGRGPGMPMFGGPGMDRMLEQVGATADQRSQIESIMKTARDDLRTQRDAGRVLHDQMRDLFVQPTVDADAVEALRQKMLAQHDAASQRMTQAMLDVSRVLTAEQRQQLADKMAERMAKRAEHMRDHPRRHGTDDERPGA